MFIYKPIRQVQVVEGDLAQSDAIGRYLETWRPECCLHTAWFVEPGKYLESVKNIDCMHQSLALLESLIELGSLALAQGDLAWARQALDEGLTVLPCFPARAFRCHWLSGDVALAGQPAGIAAADQLGFDLWGRSILQPAQRGQRRQSSAVAAVQKSAREGPALSGRFARR